MANGYTGKFLEVNLSKGQVSDTAFSENILKQYVGGRGLAAKILWDRLGKKWQRIDPLGPKNILLALTGPVTGYLVGTRVCVSGKSPSSNGIVGSTTSGEFPMELKCAGYDGVIVSGRAEKPVYLFITDNKAEIRDASKLWGLGGKDTIKAINNEVTSELGKRDRRFGEWKEPGMLYIGPAGEKMVRSAAVMQKLSHAAGYGGYGAVMGSKKLKAIVAKGTQPLPEIADPTGMQQLLTKFIESSIANDSMRRWGTGAGGFATGAGTSSEPQKNWQEEYHHALSFSVVNFETKTWVKRYWSDCGCAMSCMKLATVRDGPLAGAITDNPDYELQAYCGTNLGIYEPEGNVYVSGVVDDLGLCGINSVNTMGFAAELYQRGILTKDDFGFEPKWGDPIAMGKLAEIIAGRKKIGKILAEGTHRAAIELGKAKKMDLTKYVVQVKGIGVGGHSPRSGLGFITPIGYPCSTQGGDHTSPATPFPGGEIGSTVGDSLVFCTASLGWRYDPALLWPFYKAVTGWDLNDQTWIEQIGRRIIMIQRAALLLGGPDIAWDPAKDDDNPARFYEPLPSGPRKGSSVDKAKFIEMRAKYYADMGWDQKGIPKSEELKRLGLRDVDRVLQKTLRQA
jgi:aldehyde:ferredoxin oxidoreductase